VLIMREILAAIAALVIGISTVQLAMAFSVRWSAFG
jgi:hypothetical protein